MGIYSLSKSSPRVGIATGCILCICALIYGVVTDDGGLAIGIMTGSFFLFLISFKTYYPKTSKFSIWEDNRFLILSSVFIVVYLLSIIAIIVL